MQGLLLLRRPLQVLLECTNALRIVRQLDFLTPNEPFEAGHLLLVPLHLLREHLLRLVLCRLVIGRVQSGALVDEVEMAPAVLLGRRGQHGGGKLGNAAEGRLEGRLARKLGLHHLLLLSLMRMLLVILLRLDLVQDLQLLQ